MTSLFITILNMSITASIVAVAVMLARVPLRKAPKIFSYVLWGAVLFRLVFPFSIESIFSIMPSGAAIPQDIIYSQTPAIQTGIPIFDIPVNTAISGALPPVNPVNSVNPIHIVLEIAGYIWMAGFITLLIYAVVGYIGLKRRIRYATLVRDNIFETDKIKTPFVLGFISPKIYFPLNIDPAQHDYILKHEQHHIKRLDYLIKPLAFVVFALHWFNPLMWISYFLMSKDMEMSCDEAVLRTTNDDIRGVYSSSLLNLAVKRVGLLNPLAFGESNVKERVVNVLSFKKPKIWVLAVSVIAVSLFLVGFASNRIVNALDMPTYLLGEPTVVSATDLPTGFAGFSIQLSDGYMLLPRLDQDGLFEVYSTEQLYYDVIQHWHMSIAQLTQYATAEEWVRDIIAASYAETYMISGEGIVRTYEPPTANFPFYAMERAIASEEGHIMQRFVRDNGQGGIFLISIFLSPSDWENGRASHLMEALASFDVLAN